MNNSVPCNLEVVSHENIFRHLPKAYVPPNDSPPTKKNRPTANDKKRPIFSLIFSNLLESFVGENRWESADLGVTLNDVCADKKTKIGGC